MTEADRNDNVLAFMRARRSVPSRNLGEPGPDSAQIREMIEIASRVPDHGKLAPWRFIRYSRNYCRRLGERFADRARELNSSLSNEQESIELNRFMNAPVVIGVVSRAAPHPKIPQWEQILSGGAAAMNLLIAANAYGFDTQWITEWVATDPQLAADLGIGGDEKVVGFLHVGTRTMPKTQRDRPQIDEIFSVLGD